MKIANYKLVATSSSTLPNYYSVPPHDQVEESLNNVVEDESLLQHQPTIPTINKISAIRRKFQRKLDNRATKKKQQAEEREEAAAHQQRGEQHQAEQAAKASTAVNPPTTDSNEAPDEQFEFGAGFGYTRSSVPSPEKTSESINALTTKMTEEELRKGVLNGTIASGVADSGATSNA